MKSMIAHISPYIIGAASPIARKPPRPPHQRQPEYERDFDFKTVFYDVFY